MLPIQLISVRSMRVCYSCTTGQMKTDYTFGLRNHDNRE